METYDRAVTVTDHAPTDLPYRYPMSPYPTGWYFIGESKDLQPGDVRPIRYFGRDLVLFRTEGGEAVVLDAYCPHLGAHLGHGGTVEGEAIRCPFHSWRFEAATGQVDDIPYKTSPGLPDVQARCWNVDEVSGLIIVWFSEHGHAPSWHMPEQEHWGEDGWLGYYERQWTVRVHVQDLVENIPDTTHFVSVHHLPEYPQAKATTEGHIYHQVMGDDSYALRHAAYGLGLTWLNVDEPLRYKFLVAGTPIDEQYVDLRLLFLLHMPGETELPKQGHSILRTIEKNTSLDVNIWSHKAYHDRPPLVAGDGPIGVMRKWAKQFYETA
jgi:phenylpropionate dioxygenase-like ring-hydroxylating dioxygenase large terminal subunit